MQVRWRRFDTFLFLHELSLPKNVGQAKEISRARKDVKSRGIRNLKTHGRAKVISTDGEERDAPERTDYRRKLRKTSTSSFVWKQ